MHLLVRKHLKYAVIKGQSLLYEQLVLEPEQTLLLLQLTVGIDEFFSLHDFSDGDESQIPSVLEGDPFEQNVGLCARKYERQSVGEHGGVQN